MGLTKMGQKQPSCYLFFCVGYLFLITTKIGKYIKIFTKKFIRAHFIMLFGVQVFLNFAHSNIFFGKYEAGHIMLN